MNQASHQTQTDFTAERLERYVTEHLNKPKIKEACNALALSRRTLKRRLHEVGTSFQKVVIATRITIAQKLLRETDASITQIATDVGFATLQAFSSAFRRETGVSPSGFRAIAQKSQAASTQNTTSISVADVEASDLLVPASGIRSTSGNASDNEEIAPRFAANG